MARLGAEMRYIHDSGGVICDHTQNLPRRQCLQSLARLENGQGTKQPEGIEVSVIIHAPEVGRLCHFVNAVVT